MSSPILDRSTKCQVNTGTLFHCLWEFTMIKKFWNEVINCMSEIFRVKVRFLAKHCILGIHLKDLTYPKKQIKVVDFELLP